MPNYTEEYYINGLNTIINGFTDHETSYDFILWMAVHASMELNSSLPNMQKEEHFERNLTIFCNDDHNKRRAHFMYWRFENFQGGGVAFVGTPVNTIGIQHQSVNELLFECYKDYCVKNNIDCSEIGKNYTQQKQFLQQWYIAEGWKTYTITWADELP